jgi:hypothetical protein
MDVFFNSFTDIGLFKAMSDVSFHFHANFSDVWHRFVRSAKNEVKCFLEKSFSMD